MQLFDFSADFILTVFTKQETVAGNVGIGGSTADGDTSAILISFIGEIVFSAIVLRPEIKSFRFGFKIKAGNNAMKCSVFIFFYNDIR